MFSQIILVIPSGVSLRACYKNVPRPTISATFRGTPLVTVKQLTKMLSLYLTLKYSAIIRIYCLHQYIPGSQIQMAKLIIAIKMPYPAKILL